MCKHANTYDLDHPFLPSKTICKDCNIEITGNWSGHTNVAEFENW